MPVRREENPFVFGEVVSEHAFVDRVDELTQVVRDMSDRQKLFLLSPRRFGKSSLVAVAFERLKADGFRTVIIPVSDYASYRQFLEKFADKVVRASGPWNRVKDWVGRFLRQVKPEAALDGAWLGAPSSSGRRGEDKAGGCFLWNTSPPFGRAPNATRY